jgi:hypothetical protein
MNFFIWEILVMEQKNEMEIGKKPFLRYVTQQISAAATSDQVH